MAKSSKNQPEKPGLPVHINFDYESTKRAFNQELGYVLLKLKLKDKVICTESEMDEIISTIQNVPGGYKVIADKKYYLAIENGKKILGDVTWSNINKHKMISFQRILSVEEMFDVIAELHICQPMLSLEEIVNKLSNCNVLRCLIKLVLSSCYCSKNIRQQYETVGEMSIVRIDKFTFDDRRIFMYIERDTNYVLLRPLKSDLPSEVANELLGIFCDFGIPQYLDFRSSLFYMEVMKMLKYLPLQYSLPKTNLDSQEHKVTIMESKIRDMIEEWMKKSNSTNWVIGTHVVQWLLNTSEVCDTYIRSKVVRGPIESPYHALFGMLPHIDQVQFNFDRSKPEVRNNFPLCSQCQQQVYKVYECHFCQSICHFMCCQRVVKETMEMPIIINRCSSCDNDMSEEFILGT